MMGPHELAVARALTECSGPLSATEIARAAGVPRRTVRHHLARFVARRQVEQLPAHWRDGEPLFRAVHDLVGAAAYDGGEPAAGVPVQGQPAASGPDGDPTRASSPGTVTTRPAQGPA